MKYVYTFSVWPHERGFCKEVYTLFESLNTRIEMEFTEEEFNLFRDKLNNHGFTLREIERVPYHCPETLL